METEKDTDVRSPMIQINPEITAQIAKDLEAIQHLRQGQDRVETVTSQVTANIDQLLRRDYQQN